jgi:Nitrate and nitrite sensing/ANTAR domain
MKSALRFLKAAHEAEANELQRLTHAATLVDALSNLIHGLQRERGLANRYLAVAINSARADPCAEERRARRYAEWVQQTQHCVEVERGVRDGLSVTPVIRSSSDARLLARLAHAIQGLDALPQLRELIATRQFEHRQAVEAYSQVVASLLAVVFEAADSGTDPAITRLLVALFNQLQAKEWAGQERALGAAMWTAGRTDEDLLQRLRHLIDAQERCLAVAAEFSQPIVADLAVTTACADRMARLAQLRARLLESGALSGDGEDESWFSTCTARMDDMKTVADQMVRELVALCHQRLAVTTAEVERLEAMANQAQPAYTSALAFFSMACSTKAAAWEPYAALDSGHRRVDLAVINLVQHQAQRLETMQTELEAAKVSLHERKRIERAKGMLMSQRRMSEDDAHRFLRQCAMNQGRRLVDVADGLLARGGVPASGERTDCA